MFLRKTAIALTIALLGVSAVTEVTAQTRIRFARGRTSATVSGVLNGRIQRQYLLSAARGQYLTANISSRSGCIKFNDGSTSLSYTTGRGDNDIWVTNNCRTRDSFTLTVSIN